MRHLLIPMLMMLSAAFTLQAAEIKPGDKAPALEGITYVKGGEPKSLDAGAISVVELWATWCGPCRTSIPHLTKLKKKYGEKLQIIGISNEPVATVTPFVEEFGDQMDVCGWSRRHGKLRNLRRGRARHPLCLHR